MVIPPKKPTKETGLVLSFGSAVAAPVAPFVSGTDILGPGVAFDLRVGAYLTRHIGIAAGARFATGHNPYGCGDACVGYMYQVPVVMQLAAKDRTKGVYGELGLAFATTYSTSRGGVSATVWSPVELKLAFGGRIPTLRTAGGGVVGSLDLFIGADIGTMTSGRVEIGRTSTEGSLDGATTWHAVLSLGVASHFSL